MPNTRKLLSATLYVLATVAWMCPGDAVTAPLQCEAIAEPSRPGASLAFVLRSNADGVRVYDEMNSWGYQNRFFTANSNDGSVQVTIARRPMTWTENVFSVRVLNRGDSFATSENLCDGSWAVKPPLHGAQTLWLTPHYRNLDDERHAGLWTGEITGAAVPIRLNEKCIGWLNSSG